MYPFRSDPLATAHADDDFAQYQKLGDLKTAVLILRYGTGFAPSGVARLKDEDLFDYACVERKHPSSSYLKASFDVQAAQNGSRRLNSSDEKASLAPASN